MPFADLLTHFASGPLHLSMPNDDPDSLSVAKHRGYEIVSHSIQSALDVGRVPAPSTPNGLQVRFVGDADVDRVGLELDTLITTGSTHPEAVELGWTMSRETLTSMFPDRVWVVVEDGGLPVALASADRQDGRTWIVIFTCIDPPHRGRMLARLAKEHLRAVAWAEGAQRVETGNEESNLGIRGLNEEMGYIVTGGEYRLIRPRSGG
jgi:GNAT superfamily N-acetyltransferase